MTSELPVRKYANRRDFIGGSDARIIMGADETALVRLWREKRGELEPKDLSGDLIVQLGRVTEDLKGDEAAHTMPAPRSSANSRCASPPRCGASAERRLSKLTFCAPRPKSCGSGGRSRRPIHYIEHSAP